MNAVLIQAVQALEVDWSTRAACELTGLNRATLYRHRHRAPAKPVPVVVVQPAALSAVERELIIATATSAEFVDKSVHQMFFTLLERGVYLASRRTMYRVLQARSLVGERRSHTTHSSRAIPHLHASAPGQVTSWDITALKGPTRGVYFYAYVMIDLYSRMIPAAQVHLRQSEVHTVPFIQACLTGLGGLVPQVIHSDNGSPMIAGTVADLYAKLGITRSLSRPRVSNDNPYSEAGFKTLKHAPAYPDSFDDLPEAREYMTDFREHYNNHHYHSGLNYYTPMSVFNGTWRTLQTKRQATLDKAYKRHPERFRKPPTALPPPASAWINQPRATITSQGGPH